MMICEKCKQEYQSVHVCQLDMQLNPIVICEHDKRFSGVFDLPAGCNGCIACFAERQAKDMRRIEDAFNAMDGLILRIALLVGHNLTATEDPLSEIFGEWNRIKKAIKDEYSR